MAAITAAVIAGAGVAVAAKSAADQKKANKEAAKANKEANESSNEMNYAQWLESRGIGANGQPVNALLPRYFGATQGVNAAGQKTITGSSVINGNPAMGAGTTSNGQPLIVRQPTTAVSTAPSAYSGWV